MPAAAAAAAVKKRKRPRATWLIRRQIRSVPLKQYPAWRILRLFCRRRLRKVTKLSNKSTTVLAILTVDLPILTMVPARAAARAAAAEPVREAVLEQVPDQEPVRGMVAGSERVTAVEQEPETAEVIRHPERWA